MEVIGSLYKRKCQIKARLESIEKVLGHKNSPFLENLEFELKKDYERILCQEEVYY